MKMTSTRLTTILIAAALCATTAAPAALVGQWDFDDTNNLMKATVGLDAVPAKGNGSSTVISGSFKPICSIADTNWMATNGVTDATNAIALLKAGDGAIAIPHGYHLRLPLGKTMTNAHPWCLVMRFLSPAASAGKWRTFYSGFPNNNSDGGLFINTANKIGGGYNYTSDYNTLVSSGVWHTMVINCSNGRYDARYDGTAEVKYSNKKPDVGGHTDLTGKSYIILAGDNDTDDNLLYFSSVKLYDEAAAPDDMVTASDSAILPKPVGEWEFPADDICRATVGTNLVKCGAKSNNTAVEGQGTFTVTNGMSAKDGAVRVASRSFFKCYHGLTNSTATAYTAVMDLHVPSKTEVGNSYYRPLLQMNTANNDDPAYYLIYNGDQSLGIWYASSSIAWISPAVATTGQWIRVVASWDGTNERVYVNGKNFYNGTQSRASLKNTYFYFFADNNGEDGQTDVSYCALYDRMLTDAQVAALGGAKGASAAAALPPVPAAAWTPGVTVATNAAATTLPSVLGEDLSVGGTLTATNGPTTTTPAAMLSTNAFLRWVRATGTNAYTYVFDLKLPATATAAARLAQNASNDKFLVYKSSMDQNGSIEAELASTSETGWDGNGGFWTYYALTRDVWHRVIITRGTSGCVTYFVDGEPRWQVDRPVSGGDFLSTAAMTFLTNCAGVAVSYLAAYDTVFTTADSIPMTNALYEVQPMETMPAVPTVTGPAQTFAVISNADYAVAYAAASGDPVAAEIDFGDGARAHSGWMYGTGTMDFSHVHSHAAATNVVRVRLYTLGGHSTDWTALTNEVKQVLTAQDLCLTMPYQQNVTTNAGTVMTETGVSLDALTLQYGDGYAQSVAASGLLNGATYAYKARMTNLTAGASVPYRFAYDGQPVTGTEGVMKVWPATPPDSFKIAIWGDSQNAVKGGDWDADGYLCSSNMFLKMTTQGLDFALTTGDLAEGNTYGWVKPCLLEHPCTVLGPRMPFYVAWGNHDNVSTITRQFTEQPSLQQQGNAYYGNFYLNYGNCLFICIDYNGSEAATTKTWLANLLATDEAKKAKFRFVLKHFPTYGEVWGSISATLAQTMVDGKVDACFGGHMHGYERINHNGILQITNGGMSYLDHTEHVVNSYGDDTIVGGHKPVPGYWARQSSKGVLGPGQPIRMGCFQGYGTLEIKGDTATYEAHGFNADGSYIGVLDRFTIKSQTVIQ